MSSASVPSAGRPERPFQFTLRQLMLLISVICAIVGTWYWIGFWAVPLCGLLIAAAVFLRYGRERIGESLAILFVTAGATACLMPALQVASDMHYHRDSCRNNLHHIAMALHCYHNDYGSFPPAYVTDANGKPMHSWRVLILPFMERKDLYERYNFDEPWNGPNNSELAAEVRMPKLFSCDWSAPPDDTNYVAVVGPGSMWPGERVVKLSGFKDGTSNTIMVVEVHNSGIHWMEPRDLDLSQMPMAINPPRGQGISSTHQGGAQAALAEGSVRFIDQRIPPETLRALLTIAGGEKIEDY